ncbi:MAG: endolytic transglycosylase MltG [Dehalococcoidia bacterium]|nr:endolytic transglycosylase MltG [Dehalococcoidia bacterium]
MRRALRLAGVVAGLVLLVVAATAGVLAASPAVRDAAFDAAIRWVEPVAPATEFTPLVIPEGSSGAAIADRLVAARLVRSPTVLRLVLLYYGAERDLKSGRYAIPPGAGLRAIVDQLRAGAAEETVSVTIPEGLRSEEIAALLEANGVALAADFLRLVRAGTSSRSGFAWTAAGTPLEGFLFPDTYHVPPAYGAGPFLELVLGNFDRNLAREMREKPGGQSRPVRELVTLASIVERETPHQAERPVVAGVFLNRLDIDMPLGADPTVQFALTTVAGSGGEYWKRDLTLEDLKVGSPYNTYTNVGLPPGPICNPGAASLAAVLAPAKSSYLFFVAKPDGTHAFSTTFGEHQFNVARFQP